MTSEQIQKDGFVFTTKPKAGRIKMARRQGGHIGISGVVRPRGKIQHCE